MNNEKVVCDICGSDMSVKGDKGVRIEFSCTGADCEQSWIVDQDGQRCVVKHLWPSRMSEDSEMYRNKFLPSWMREKIQWATRMFVAGFWDQSKKESFIRQCRETYDKWFEDHPLAKVIEKRKWWQFWQKA